MEMGTGPGKGGTQGSYWWPKARGSDWFSSTETPTSLGLERASQPIPSLLKPRLPAAISTHAAQVKSLLPVLLLDFFGFALSLPLANLTSTVFKYISVQIINAESELHWPKKKPLAEARENQCRDRHGPIYGHFWGFNLV